MIISPPVIIVFCFTFCFFFTTAGGERKGKSLLSSFPFNQHGHGQHGDHETSSDTSDGRDSRQGYGGTDDVDSLSFDEISTGEEEADGKEGAGYYCDNGDLSFSRYLIINDNRVRVTEVCQQDAVSGGDGLH